MKAKTEKVPIGKWIILAVAVFCMFATGIMVPPAGLSQAGYQILGILVGAILLFLSWGTGWTSMAIVFALMTVPGLSSGRVTQATFGNGTAVFILFLMMLAVSLIKSGIARRIAIWFMTNSLARKSPWWTVAMIFIANFILNLFLSGAAVMMVMLPIIEEILTGVGYKKENKPALATVLMLGVLVTSLLSNSGNPISHTVTLQGFSFYESYTGEAMDFFTYCAVGTPLSIITSILFYLVVRFIWRPDVSALASVDYNALAETCPPMSKREKWALFFYAICILLWMLPGVTKYVWPAANKALFSKINSSMPALCALFLMNFIKIDGEKILDWNDAVKYTSWSTYLFCATIIGLGSFMGDSNIGISAWMSDMLSPIFANISPMMFLVIIVVFINVMTNFCSNSVAIAVSMAIAMPLAMGVYAGRISPFLVACVITINGNNGWSTPPAGATAAMVFGTDWVSNKQMLGYGLITALVSAIASCTLGVWICNALV